TGGAAGQRVVIGIGGLVAFRTELREHDPHAVLAGHPLDPANDLHSPHVLKLVEDELHHVTAVGPAVPVFVDQGLYAGTRARGHPGTAVDDFGHRGDRHTGGRGDVGDRHGLGRIAPPT